MSDYLTIEQVKQEIRKYYGSTNYNVFELLDRLEPPDAKLRRVRDEITDSLADLTKGITNTPSDQHWKSGLLTMLVKAQSIIDSHLTPSEPEVDEAEKFRKEADDLIERISNAVDKLGK